MNGKIIIAGGTGSLGTHLLDRFKATDRQLIVLTRSAKKLDGRDDRVRYVIWDGESIGPWARELEGATAIINLSGRNVNCRFTTKNKREILDSRVRSTKVIGLAIQQCNTPPQIWINAGGISHYPETSNPLSEYDQTVVSGFLSEVSEQWEAAFNQVDTSNTRKVQFRIAAVLEYGQGMLKPLTWLTRLGLGGAAGNGKQYISWIHYQDLVRLFEWAILNNDIAGIINASSPNPIQNKYFMRALRAALHVPFGLPNFSWTTRIGGLIIGTEADLILHGNRIISKVLEEKQFSFDFSSVDKALKDIFNKHN
ncbi:hypothetical protein SAMN05216436_11493 [bacterium A37T11]|nr:hypothetical protein SAMN05216436_11493 [bacterium A37T11]